MTTDNTNRIIEGESTEKPVFDTRLVFLKESHITSPEAPAIFKQPQQYAIKFEIAVSFNELEEHVHEVCLKLTVNAYPKKESQKTDEQVAASSTPDIDPDATPVYTAEVHQAGVYVIKGLDETQAARVKRITCAEMLFPFARSHLVHLVTQAGFPPVYLSPVNFAAVNAQVEEQEKQKSSEKEALLH